MRHRSLHALLLCCSIGACSDDNAVPPSPEAGPPDIALDLAAPDRARPDSGQPREGGKREAAVAPDRPADRTLQLDLGLRLVLKGPCDSGCPPACGAIGSKSEGWYTCKNALIGWTLCSKCTKPTCQFVGTTSEGWYSSCP